MSFFGKIKNLIIDKIVDDEFYQPLSEHEIYSVINSKRENKQTQAHMKSSYSVENEQINVFDIVYSLADRTPELQFRLLGYDPSLQSISKKKEQLKSKLDSIDEYLLIHYQNYLLKITESINFYDDGKQFFSTRKKSAELRFIIERMNRILSKIKVITKLNIKIKNIKSTLKIIEKVPNIKQMNLMQLKSIDLQKLQKCNDEIRLTYNKNLACLINLSKYIKKVNNQSFAFIINNLKMCLDSYDQQVYEEVMKNYLIIQPQTTLEKLIGSLIEDKVRNLFDNSNLGDVGHNLLNLIINIHKIFKWHLLNRAVRNKGKQMQTQSQLDNQPLRRLSITSDRSDEGSVASFQLNDIVYIDLRSLKEVFNRIADGCLTDLVADNFLSIQISNTQLYPILFTATKISQVCNNFTGLHFSKLKKILIQYYTKKQSALYMKLSREFISSIQQEKGDWNRIPYSNNFRFTELDRLVYRWTNIQSNENYKKADSTINRLFIEQIYDYSQQQSQSSDEQTLELKNIKLDSADKLEKRFEQWRPKDYLKQYEGDVILCQSSFKILVIIEKYTQFLIYVPACQFVKQFYEHLINFFEYTAYFVFSSLLNAKYKSLFFEKSTSDMLIEKIYTLKRFKSLYPQLASFVNAFKVTLENNTNKSLQFFRKDIKQIFISQQNHALRAKVIAVQSYKFCLAYLYQVLKTDPYSSAFKQDSSILFERINNIKCTLNELETILLTQSIQGMVNHELQTIKSLFQSIRWYQSYQDLKEYIQKIIGIIRESYQKLRSCNRGEIPASLIQTIFVFIWRTITTFSVKLFLENKNNNKRANKLNFQRFIDQIYLAFEQNENKALVGLSVAYNIFKSIFKILFSSNWQQCKQYLVETLKKYDYIYPILINILQMSEYMGSLSQKQKDLRRQEFRQEIETIFKQK